VKRVLLVLTAASCALLAQPPAGGPGRGGPARGGNRPPAYQPPAGEAPKTSNGKPDFSGIWARPYVPDVTRDKNVGGELPYTAWGKAQWDNYHPEKDGDYTGSCLPFGHMRAMGSPDPIEIVQTNTRFAILYEQNSWFKVFPIGGKHDPDKVPTWFGDSISYWDGDTLVVDTTNFNGLTRLDTNGHPHSDQLHLIERYTRPDLGHIQYEVTVDDPKTYTKPWKNVRTFTLRTDWDIQEYSCEENNKGLVEGRIKVPNYEGSKK
jgi:hypothetical protein